MKRLPIIAAALSLCFSLAQGGENTMRAGAARLDITPPEEVPLPMSGYGSRTQGFQGIHDNLFVRAIVIADGSAEVALVTCDLIGFSHEYWQRISGRISSETGIPREHILLAGTHTHGGPALGPVTDDEIGSQRAAYVGLLEQRIVAAVREARQKLQPVRVGFGAGAVTVNMNRRARMGDGGWGLGNNPEGPSDKTVGVIRFEALDGRPLAFLINYAVHGTVLGPRNDRITSDLPGATSRFVEEHFGDKVVAAWTAGASGDQDPIYRVGTDFDQRTALGRILAEEVLRVGKTIRASSVGRVGGMQKMISCPGKKTATGNKRLPGGNYEFLDADPVEIRLSLVMLNHIALAAVSGEVLTRIGQRLKQESPFSGTMMVTHANGSSGYVPDDASYDQVSYEILTTRVKRGCAESAIVNGFLEMMDRW